MEAQTRLFSSIFRRKHRRVTVREENTALLVLQRFPYSLHVNDVNTILILYPDKWAKYLLPRSTVPPRRVPRSTHTCITPHHARHFICSATLLTYVRTRYTGLCFHCPQKTKNPQRSNIYAMSLFIFIACALSLVSLVAPRN